MFKEHILYFFVTKWSFCSIAPFPMVVNFQGFSRLNPLFLELKLKCLRMIKHHGWFVLGVGRRVALRPSHGHVLGKQVLMKGTWPTGVPAHITSSFELWDLFKSTRSPHSSICLPHVTWNWENGSAPLFPCFGYTGLRSQPTSQSSRYVYRSWHLH